MSFPSYPYAPVSSAVQRPAFGGGTFILDGATNPSQFAGDVIAVRRLEEASDPFFRITLPYPFSRDQAGNRSLESFLVLTVHDPAGQTQVTATEANRTDDGGDIRNDLRELDISVVESGSIVTDTAGFRIDFLIHFSLAPRK